MKDWLGNELREGDYALTRESGQYGSVRIGRISLIRPDGRVTIKPLAHAGFTKELGVGWVRRASEESGYGITYRPGERSWASITRIPVEMLENAMVLNYGAGETPLTEL